MIPFILIALLQAAVIEPQPLPAGVEDNGINVLLDNAHDVRFFWLWDTRDRLREKGFRVTGSQATLDTVLKPGGLSRMRDQAHHDFGGRYHRPFVMLPNPRFNVLVTYQFTQAQPYLAREADAVEAFVRDGGGLVVFAGQAGCPVDDLLARFDASVSDAKAKAPYAAATHEAMHGFRTSDTAWRTLKTGSGWTPSLRGDGGTVAAARQFGRGRVVVFADPGPYDLPGGPNTGLLASVVRWAAGGSEPVGGSRAVPWEHAGVGGAVYPENSVEVAGVTVLYAGNQMPGVLEAVRNRTKEVKNLLDRMIPSPPREPNEMYIIPAAGAPGSGWAVNVYTPKEAQICSHDRDINALLSVMAHEIAHTMTGPAASDGSTGGQLPEMGVGLFSEAHAGWFQRKVGLELGWEKSTQADRALALRDPTLRELDLRKVTGDTRDVAWGKLWRVYQILEYRHGEAWYANWMKLLHERYKADPGHALTWRETIATMSESVGEDLFPLFASLGTSVDPPSDWSLPPMKPR